MGYDLMDAALPLMSRQEELEWFSRLPDPAAEDRIIRSNLKFIEFLAQSCHSFYSPPLEDLISEGILAMLQVMPKFDLSRGVLFRTYAYRCAKTAIVKYIWTHLLGERFMSQSKDRVNALLAKIYSLDDIKAEMIDDNEHVPSIAELLEAAEFTKEETALYMRAFGETIDIDGCSYEEGESLPWLEKFAASGADQLAEAEFNDRVEHAVDAINSLDCQKTAYIIKQYYGLDGVEPLSIALLAEVVHWSVSQTSLMKQVGLERVRSAMLNMEKPTAE